MCNARLFVMWDKDGKEITKKCGDLFAGGELLCQPCLIQARKDYPQGWRYYPGDKCKHGNYVGGNGRDLMCGKCENGE